MLRIALILSILLSLLTSAAAIVGDAPEVPDAKSQPEVMLVGQHGFCSGVAITPDLVLTAASLRAARQTPAGTVYCKSAIRRLCYVLQETKRLVPCRP
jgi:hypothetical protein